MRDAAWSRLSAWVTSRPFWAQLCIAFVVGYAVLFVACLPLMFETGAFK